MEQIERKWHTYDEGESETRWSGINQDEKDEDEKDEDQDEDEENKDYENS